MSYLVLFINPRNFVDTISPKNLLEEVFILHFPHLVSHIFPGPVSCQTRVEHEVIDTLLYPCLYICPFSSCTVFFTEHSTRHCSIEQCTHTDRLIESKTNTDTYLSTPTTQEVLPHPSCSIEALMLM